jgi:hypothetical protein
VSRSRRYETVCARWKPLDRCKDGAVGTGYQNGEGGWTMHVTQHVILSYLDQRKYRHTTMVRHQGQVIVLGMDVAGVDPIHRPRPARTATSMSCWRSTSSGYADGPLTSFTALYAVRDGAGR